MILFMKVYLEELTVENVSKLNKINNITINDISLNDSINYLRENSVKDPEEKTNSECSSRISNTDTMKMMKSKDSESEYSDDSEYSSIDDCINAYVYNFPVK